MQAVSAVAWGAFDNENVRAARESCGDRGDERTIPIDIRPARTVVPLSRKVFLATCTTRRPSRPSRGSRSGWTFSQLFFTSTRPESGDHRKVRGPRRRRVRRGTDDFAEQARPADLVQEGEVFEGEKWMRDPVTSSNGTNGGLKFSAGAGWPFRALRSRNLEHFLSRGRVRTNGGSVVVA